MRSCFTTCFQAIILQHRIVLHACIAVFLAGLVAVSYVPWASAQGMLDELEIIGSDELMPRTGDVVDSEHTGSAARIPSERLLQPGSELGAVLSGVSGVQQRQSGGFGSFSSITVRAATPAQTAVYLDGILLNSGGRSIIDLSTLEILNLGSVDIYKGSAPLQLGHGSIGGAINLNTMRAGEQSGPRLRLGLGSFSHYTLSASQQMRAKHWDWTGSVSHQQSDNDFPFLNDNPTPLNPDDDVVEKRQNNQVRRSSLMAKGGYQFSAMNRTDILWQLADREAGVPTALNDPDNHATYATVDSQLQLTQTIDQWKGWNSRHTLYWHLSDSHYDDAGGDIRLTRQRVNTDTSTLGIRSYWETFINAGTFGLSVDARSEVLEQQTRGDFPDQTSADRQRFLATAHLALADASERFLLTPAIRWQSNSGNGQSSSSRVTDAQLKQSDSELGAQLGARVVITPQWTLSANAANYYREPSFDELFGATGLINGNPNLRAEQGNNLDIGLAFDTDTLQLQASLFQSRRDQLIVTSFNGQGFGNIANSGKADVSGLEISASWNPSSAWQLIASATAQDPRNRDPRQGNNGKLLPGEARKTAFLRVRYKPSAIAYWYEWQATRERFYDVGNIIPAADTSLHNVGLDIRHGAWEFSVRLQNVGDDIVEDFNGFPKTGRNLSMAVTLAL